MNEIIIQTNKLCKTFSTGGHQQHVLKNLDLEIQKGDFTVIMGASGSGKSTLLYALSGMDKPTLGEVRVADTAITAMDNQQLALFRRHNGGFVFQQIHLLDNMSVLDNVLACGRLIKRSKSETISRAKELLLQVGIGDADWDKFPSQLSGGEAQRVGIVRALINKPAIVFANEPTGALNSLSGGQVLDTLTDVNKKGQSLVVVTHDMRTARRGGPGDLSEGRNDFRGMSAHPLPGNRYGAQRKIICFSKGNGVVSMAVWMLTRANLRSKKGMALSMGILMMLSVAMLHVGMTLIFGIQDFYERENESLSGPHYVLRFSGNEYEDTYLDFFKSDSRVESVNSQAPDMSFPCG